MAGHGFGPDFYNLVLDKAREPLSDLTDFFAQQAPKSQPTDALPDVHRVAQYQQDFAQSPIAQAFYNASGGTALSAITSTPKMPGASTLPYFGPGVDTHGAAINPRIAETQTPQKTPMIWTPDRGIVEAPEQAPQPGTTPNPTSTSYAPTGRNIAPRQFGDPTMSFSDMVAACGPTAAIAFVHQTGRNMTVGEATNIARGQPGPQDDLWDPGVGMHGPDAEVQLLGRMGIQAEADYTPSPNEIVSRIHNGEAVIVSSPGYNHYFVITDFNPQTNMFYVGNTGNVWSDKSRNADWLSFGQIMPQASIYFAPGQVSDALSDTNGTQQPQQPEQTAPGGIERTGQLTFDPNTPVWTMADSYSQQYGLKDVNVLKALILAESGGDPHQIGDNGNSVGLLQNNMHGGRGQGHSQESLLDPNENIAISMPEISAAYRRALSEGYDEGTPEFAMRVGQIAQRPRPDLIHRYADAYTVVSHGGY